jgi:hypothetical protein
MKSILITIVFSLIPVTFAAAKNLKDIEAQCVRAYERVDAILPFFYKFEGNLPPIKDSKIKSIKHFISEFENFKISAEGRKRAFAELFEDADYHQYLLQEKSVNLIKELEQFRSKSSPVADKNLIFALPKLSPFGDYENPYSKILKLVRIQNEVRNFFDELENASMRLEQLNQLHRLNKSLDADAQRLGFTIPFIKNSMTSIIQCNLDYLEAERLSK